MNVDLVLINSKFFMNGRLLEGGIACEEGKIVAIGKEVNLPKGEVIIDVGGNLILPGLIDVHVHFRDPGLTHKEDFLTGTKAAAAGGVTTVIDEPNNKPPIISMKALNLKKRIAEDNSLVDFTFSLGLNSQNLEQISEFIARGIVSFDIFSGGLGDQLSVSDTGTFLEALTLIRDTGALACLTCRDFALNKWTAQKLKEAGEKDIISYYKSYPSIGEALGATRNILLTDYADARVHLRQISSFSTVSVLKSMKAKCQKISSEVSPHHLMLSLEDAKKLGPYGKVSPPIRTKEDTEAIWSALVDGTIDIIATDHAPHTREEKDAGLDNIWEAPSGLPGIETLLPLMLTQVNAGRISLQRLVEATSELPAKIFNLFPMKGAIQVGSHADLVLIDLKRKGRILGESLHSKSNWTPFEGWEIKGLPVMTIVRGKKVMEEGKIIGKPGHGIFIAARAQVKG